MISYTDILFLVTVAVFLALFTSLGQRAQFGTPWRKSTFFIFLGVFIFIGCVIFLLPPRRKKSLASLSQWHLREIITKNDQRGGRFGKGLSHFFDYKVNEQSEDGSLLLVIAAAQANLNAVKELLSAGADPNIQDKNGMAALHMAAYYGDEALVKELIAHGANKQLKDNRGYTPSMLAHEKGRYRIEKLLE
ncbi:MAG: ankyrin repeat domain-containing protein [Candidatus Babeliales bacterium]